jgi:hypothetical protein
MTLRILFLLLLLPFFATCRKFSTDPTPTRTPQEEETSLLRLEKQAYSVLEFQNYLEKKWGIDGRNDFLLHALMEYDWKQKKQEKPFTATTSSVPQQERYQKYKLSPPQDQFLQKITQTQQEFQKAFYTNLCKEQNRTIQVPPEKQWISEVLRSRYSVKFPINFPQQLHDPVFWIEEQAYPRKDFLNYLLQHYTLDSLDAFLLWNSAQLYATQEKITWKTPEQLEKQEEIFFQECFRKYAQSHTGHWQKWLNSNGLTQESLLQYSSLLVEEGLLFSLLLEHLASQDSFLQNYFCHHYAPHLKSTHPPLAEIQKYRKAEVRLKEALPQIFTRETFQQRLPQFLHEKKQALAQIRSDILKGSLSFEQAVEKYSEDVRFKNLQGQIGVVDGVNWLPPYFEEAQKLQAGEISPPFHTPLGIYLLKAEEILPESLLCSKHFVLRIDPVASADSGIPRTSEELEKQTKEIWEKIQKSPDPVRTYMQFFYKAGASAQSFGPIVDARVFPAYSEHLKKNKNAPVLAPLQYGQEVYFIKPEPFQSGRRCRQIEISTQFPFRLEHFQKTEAKAFIEKAMYSVLLAGKTQETLEQALQPYKSWLNLSVSEQEEEKESILATLKSLAPAEFTKPTWKTPEICVSYQLLERTQRTFSEVQSKLKQHYLQDPNRLEFAKNFFLTHTPAQWNLSVLPLLP